MEVSESTFFSLVVAGHIMRSVTEKLHGESKPTGGSGLPVDGIYLCDAIRSL